MHRRSVVFLIIGLLLLFPLGASALSAARPEEVGLSSERLARIGQALTRQIDPVAFRVPLPWWRVRSASRTSKPSGSSIPRAAPRWPRTPFSGSTR
jgi:hypothetical protein